MLRAFPAAPVQRAPHSSVRWKVDRGAGDQRPTTSSFRRRAKRVFQNRARHTRQRNGKINQDKDFSKYRRWELRVSIAPHLRHGGGAFGLAMLPASDTDRTGNALASCFKPICDLLGLAKRVPKLTSIVV